MQNHFFRFQFRQYSFIASLVLCASIAFGQKQDNIWLMGYAGGSQSPMNDYFGLSIFHFGLGGHLTIENNQTSDLNFQDSNSSICDSSGMLLFYTNAERIYTADHTLMTNGNGLNATNQYGAIQPQGVISLPVPGRQDQYLVLVTETKVLGPEFIAGIKLYKNIIEINPNNISESKVLEKKVVVISDTIEYGQVTAVKHANGLDWWILVPEVRTNSYYTLLLTKQGLQSATRQSVGDIIDTGLGQCCFSPDGKKFARANDTDLTLPTQLYLYDFDRCTGLLTNPIHTEYETAGLGTGCAFSLDSRFLYAINASYIFQYDLTASDFAASKTLVSEWDGSVWLGHFYTTFAFPQLAPDGKIYICTAGSTPYLHVIEYPNRKGVDCLVRRQGIELPNINNLSIPNFPNFRLGPVDGSSCDTIGYDNFPLCNWRWNQEDTLDPLQITFTDLSAYEPNNWDWDFGDGIMSQDTSPIHIYDTAGIYQVCLIIHNAAGSDTFCSNITNWNHQCSAGSACGSKY